MRRAVAMDPVDAFIDAFNARDLDGALAPIGEGYVLEMPPGAVILRGREALRASYRELFMHSPELHVEVLSRIRVGPWVIDEHRLTGWNLTPAPPEHVVDIFEVVDGQIVRVLILS
jgi:hypothetical protein